MVKNNKDLILIFSLVCMVIGGVLGILGHFFNPTFEYGLGIIGHHYYRFFPVGLLYLMATSFLIVGVVSPGVYLIIKLVKRWQRNKT